jgi:hypothetical protein
VAICNFIRITKTQTSIFQKIAQIQYHKSDKLAELEKRQHALIHFSRTCDSRKITKCKHRHFDILWFSQTTNFHNLRFFFSKSLFTKITLMTFQTSQII